VFEAAANNYNADCILNLFLIASTLREKQRTIRCSAM